MYYLIEIIKFNDGTKESYGIYPYDNLKECLSKFHKEIGGWIVKENVETVICSILDENGNTTRSETQKNTIE